MYEHIQGMSIYQNNERRIREALEMLALLQKHKENHPELLDRIAADTSNLIAVGIVAANSLPPETILAGLKGELALAESLPDEFSRDLLVFRANFQTQRRLQHWIETLLCQDPDPCDQTMRGWREYLREVAHRIDVMESKQLLAVAEGEDIPAEGETSDPNPQQNLTGA